jgi:hypothetical protein
MSDVMSQQLPQGSLGRIARMTRMVCSGGDQVSSRWECKRLPAVVASTSRPVAVAFTSRLVAVASRSGMYILVEKR